jgi:prevent-host-death family protein
MQVPISEAKAKLTDLVRRAESGEQVALTRYGQVVARIVPEVRSRSKSWQDMTVDERRHLLKGISDKGGKLTSRFNIDWRKAQDDLYDDDGLPA